MKVNLSLIIRYISFWILFFALERLIFLIWFSGQLENIALSDILKSFAYGFWIDASMTGYICVLPLLFSLVQLLIPAIKYPSRLLLYYNYILIGLFSIVCIVNLNIYREWGSKINFKALDFAIGSPGEAMASSASSPIVSSLIVLAILLSAAILLFKKLVIIRRLQKGNYLVRLAFAFLLIALNFLAIRGGWQLSPMNESMAYYSPKPLLNHAAVNTEYSLLKDILKNKSKKNPYQYYSNDDALKIVNTHFVKPVGKTPSILTSDKPNVILIIQEGFTAGLMKSLGGEKGIAPEIEGLAKNGLLFENIYSSGDRTDKGIIAILSGFPSQAVRSIIKVNPKQEKLPALSDSFYGAGYKTAFFYGGESEFFNMKSYLLSHNFQKIIDKKEFKLSDMNSKWGAFDGPVYDRLLDDASKTQEPFFYTLLTLTNHEPFELPVQPHFRGEEIENKFKSTAYYADSCLGAFIKNAKTQSWYKNTLFIVVADHGHRLPKNDPEIYHPNRFHIPLLFYGEVLRKEFKGKRIPEIASQTDIAATILSQLKLNYDNYKWSRDILNPETEEIAFFNWDNGFGVTSPSQTISFDNVGKTVIYRKNKLKSAQDEKLVRFGKAYMQSVYQTFLNY